MILKTQTINYIKQHFSRYKVIQTKSLHHLPADIQEDLQNQIKQIPEYENIRNLIHCIAKDIELKHCVECNKLLKFSQSYIGHENFYCSFNCMNKSSIVKQKRKQTNIKIYGSENVLSNKQIRQKIKQTCLQKYGTDNPAKNDKIKQKIFNTNIQKYGNKCSLQNEQIINKSKQTCLQRYGYQYSTQSDAINQKRKQSYYDNWNSNKHIVARVRKKLLFNEYQKIQTRWSDYVELMFSLEEYEGQKKTYKWKCVKCGNIFEQKIHTTNFNKDDWGTPRCPKCYPILKFISNKQQDLLEFIKSIYASEIKTNDKSLIKPYELDIVLPELKLAIQFNGIYWHSINKKDKNYHLNKTELCESKGYRLIHIWQDEWMDDKHSIMNKLKSIIENNEIIEGEIFDRCWYSTLQFQNYEIIEPIIIIRDGFQIWNCGFIKT